MPRLETIRAKVGATILDVFRPGWAHAVVPEALDLAECTACVLGQLYGRFERGAETLFAMRKTSDAKVFSKGIESASVDAGFYIPSGERETRFTEYDTLTAAWKREIAKRVGG